MRVLTTLVLASLSPYSLACSFPQPLPVELNRKLAEPGETRPSVPNVSVESVHRGDPNSGLGSCVDTGVIVLTIPANEGTSSLVYSFKLVSGKADDLIFFPGTYKGFENKESGKIEFIFPWLDGATQKQEPLNLVVKVTPYRISGLKGKPAKISVKDPGR